MYKVLSDLQVHCLLLVHTHWMLSKELLHAQVFVATCYFWSFWNALIQVNIKLKHHILPRSSYPRLLWVKMTTFSFMLLLYPVHTCTYYCVHQFPSVILCADRLCGLLVLESLVHSTWHVVGVHWMFTEWKDEVVARLRKWGLICLLEFYNYWVTHT